VTSMRTHARRLLRWQRYAEKTGWYPCWTCFVAYKPPPGWNRALAAQHREWLRRNPIPRDYRDPWWDEP
jgi:hypothetical protein